ncbi:MGH1-like glycoside hydrolase domain-containing protein [Phormidium tenue]|uniref:Glucosidase n=1 Tax=Phormidium tenue NIES-30 TaxID=549789 RepID=A0A1U7J8N9_9CYAN|nr:glucosidase [Phormidium tenue]MBD2231403.1 glucosidase [Phormidium tenue FACHB-1052]OKH49631.1 glucosidase [Phormidium tenue NIES-30]
MSAEANRLAETRAQIAPWQKWGPYLSERQWGTVREDYSTDGNAWDYFPHDQARSRAYRWGEDGLGGITDDHNLLCFALALWNGQDPILKERLFGLTNSQGNHGEDVKEYYFYLDSTPTHSYMKYLYKYPQAAYPYEDLVNTNRSRNRYELEYELLDTGIFDDDRYFDVFVEYAKADAEDVLIQISVANRGLEAAPLHLLPTLWFRNTWSWKETGEKSELKALGNGVVQACVTNPELTDLMRDYYFYCDAGVPLLFTENETNNERIFGTLNSSPYVKDGINNYVVDGKTDLVNPDGVGTKVSPHYQLTVGAGETVVVKLRLTKSSPDQVGDPFGAYFDDQFAARLKEADEFYATVIPPAILADGDRANVMRQALAGMMWTKQYFYYDLDLWLRERNVTPWTPVIDKRNVRNSEWFHMMNDDIVSMPDKWEYPWYAAWDLAFHVIPISLIDPDFAKSQLMLMLREDYLHPNGQIPAYEWNFGDVNPPVHAFATWEIYVRDRERNNGQGDLEFLKYAFSKLLINFTWWVNRKDEGGNNLFEGGFLGLDNIGVFDRSSPLPTGGRLEQADGTAWMVFFSQRMFQIAIELALHDHLYEDLAIKFFEHTMWIAGAMDRIGTHQDELWDEEDGFFYDVLRLPDGNSTRLKVRSLVGLLSLMAVAVFPREAFTELPRLRERVEKFIARHPELVGNVHLPIKQGYNHRLMLSILNEDKLRKVLSRMLDEGEFLSDYGIRSLSRFHHDHPYVFYHAGQEYKVGYVPGDSTSGMFGGNSNWRGPIWMPVNLLLIRALLQLYSYYGDDFKLEYPTGSGDEKTLFEITQCISERLVSIFTKDENGRRPVYGGAEKFQTDPHWQDLILFYEYFHGDDGSGIGASHQTGWTGCIARIIQALGYFTPDTVLETISPGELVKYSV